MLQYAALPDTAPASQSTLPARTRRRQAAMVSFLAHSNPEVASCLSMLPQELRPMRYDDAVSRLRGLSGAERKHVVRVAAAQLMGLRGLSETQFRRHGMDLLNDSSLVDALVTARQDGDPIGATRNLFDGSQTPESLLGLQLGRNSGDTRDENLLRAENSVSFDPKTLLTTVVASTFVKLTDAQLCFQTNPQCWHKLCPDIWRASDVKSLDPVTRQFLPQPQLPDDQSWNNYLYEWVDTALNETVITSFQNYLRVSFQVNHTGQDGKGPISDMSMRFSLYYCQGSMLLGTVMPIGINVDTGMQTVTPIPMTADSKAASQGSDNGTRLCKIVVTKKVRFSDTASRNTTLQSLPGMGNSLSYMAPAIVGLWMFHIVSALGTSSISAVK
jgi:hypothetical protein